MLTDVSSPVVAQMAVTAESIAYRKRYNLVLYNTRDDVQRERFYVNSVVQRWLDGVLYISAQDESTIPALLEEVGIPVVVIDRTPRDYSGPSVVLDNVEAGRIAGEHLLSLGHHRIAHVGGPSFVHMSEERLEGLQDAMQSLSGKAELSVVQAQDWRMESGYSAAKRLLNRDSEFTALFAAGDLLAIGAMRALREHGLRVPDDVSVVGLDDIEIGRYLAPPLTTVRQSIAEMAETGMRILLDIISGDPPEQSRVVMSPQIIVRESTRALGE
jgi:DNA-binding LacI/PurR family transcriptional regulator